MRRAPPATALTVSFVAARRAAPRRTLLVFGGAAAIAVVVSLASCTPLVANAYPPAGAVTMSTEAPSSTWSSEVAAATRRIEPYDWVMRQADLRATLITPRLRRAFLDEREHFHGRFADQTQQELVGLGSADEGVDGGKTLAQPGGEEEVMVFVAMYVADQKNRDLSASYTIWNTTLARGGQKVRPSKVENVRASPAVREVFPYIDRFDDLYLFRFPLVDAKSGTRLFAPGSEPLVLEVSSALANCIVSWDLQG